MRFKAEIERIEQAVKDIRMKDELEGYYGISSDLNAIIQNCHKIQEKVA